MFRTIQSLFQKLTTDVYREAEPQPATHLRVGSRRIIDELLLAFQQSLQEESTYLKLIPHCSYVICMHPDVYERQKAAFKAVVDEVVIFFDQKLQTALEMKRKEASGLKIAPLATRWQFQFVATEEFAQETIKPDNLLIFSELVGPAPDDTRESVTGPTGATNRRGTVRNAKSQTFRNLAMALDQFPAVAYESGGLFWVPILRSGPKPSSMPASAPTDRLWSDAPLARIRVKPDDADSWDYFMHKREITIARKEPDNDHYEVRIESRYVSNPHARIRYNDTLGHFEVAVLSNKETLLDEQPLTQSLPEKGQFTYTPLALGSKLLLNHMVELEFFPNL
ncbi:FHA domain-containing protein [Spirosoma panaciterrae]|uniref:FHA domain-containing protein n=1 Tax=Spirosoma panaciterrae TaxID=496058 RepID=UPI00037FF672|nr:FHA domain-containing protein [Spirosoma panaciterrae]